jgi:DDE_Tnp_1-associated
VSSSPDRAAFDHLEDLPTDLSAQLAHLLGSELVSGQDVLVSSLARALAGVADPRCARGMRHPVLAVLLISACAVLSGARSYVGISEWADHLGHHVLDHLDMPGPAPSESTLRRTLQAINTAALEAALSTWSAGQLAASAAGPGVGPGAPRGEGRQVIAIDGKTLRGSAARATAMTSPAVTC